MEAKGKGKEGGHHRKVGNLGVFFAIEIPIRKFYRIRGETCLNLSSPVTTY
jgi:hypothetical protein